MAPDITAILRSRGLVSTITVEPYEGQGGAVPLYGAPVVVEAYVERKRRVVRNPQAERVVSSSTAYCRLAVTAPPKSKVTVDGEVTYVINQGRNDGAGLPLPSHLELFLT